MFRPQEVYRGPLAVRAAEAVGLVALLLAAGVTAQFAVSLSLPSLPNLARDLLAAAADGIALVRAAQA